MNPEKGFDTAADDPRSFPAVPLPVANVLPPADPVVPAWLTEVKADLDRWQAKQERGRRVAFALLPLYLAAMFAAVWCIGSLPGWKAGAMTGALFVLVAYQWFLPYITARWVQSPSIRQTDAPEAPSVDK